MVSETDITANVAFGYLSVLLGYLSLTPTVRERIGMQSQKVALTQIIKAIEEFLQYHRRIADEMRQVTQEADPKAGFVTQWQNVIASLQQVERSYDITRVLSDDIIVGI